VNIYFSDHQQLEENKRLQELKWAQEERQRIERRMKAMEEMVNGRVITEPLSSHSNQVIHYNCMCQNKFAGKKEAGLLENDGGREYETCSKAEGTASTHQRRVHEARRGGRVLQEISN
jgi:hypothetical protein